MTKDYLEEVKSAQALASEVDPEYRIAAFQAILLHRLLTKEVPIKVAAQGPKGANTPPKTTNDPVSVFMNDTELDASNYSQLLAAPRRLLEKSLAVLRIARDKFAIDGLSPGDIAKILTEKFRVAKVQDSNVRAELRKATAFVSRVSADRGYRYLLMGTGESYLEETLDHLSQKES